MLSKLLKFSGPVVAIAGCGIFLLALAIDLRIAGMLTSWTAVFLLGITVSLLLLLGLQAIYLSQIDAVGGIGLMGYLFAFVGTTLTGGVMFYSYVISALAQREPLLAEYVGAGVVLTGGADALMIASGITLLMGWIILGWATFRARIYPRWIGFLIAFGLPLGLPLRLPFPGGRSLGFAVWAIGFVGLGMVLWRSGDRESQLIEDK